MISRIAQNRRVLSYTRLRALVPYGFGIAAGLFLIISLGSTGAASDEAPWSLEAVWEVDFQPQPDLEVDLVRVRAVLKAQDPSEWRLELWSGGSLARILEARPDGTVWQSVGAPENLVLLETLPLQVKAVPFPQIGVATSGLTREDQSDTISALEAKFPGIDVATMTGTASTELLDFDADLAAAGKSNQDLPTDVLDLEPGFQILRGEGREYLAIDVISGLPVLMEESFNGIPIHRMELTEIRGNDSMGVAFGS